MARCRSFLLFCSLCTSHVVLGVRVTESDMSGPTMQETPLETKESDEFDGADAWGELTQEQYKFYVADTWKDLAEGRLRDYFGSGSGFIPYAEHPVPYTKRKVRACLQTMRCDRIRKGIGRRRVVWQWIVAILVPLIVVLLHVVGTSCVFRTSRTSGKLERDTKSAFSAMFVSSIFAVSIGYHTYLVIDNSIFDWCLTGLSLLLMTLSNIAVFGFVCVEFDWPDLCASPFLLGVSLMLVVSCYLARMLLWFSRILFLGSHTCLNMYYHLFFFVYLMLGGMLPPNCAMLLWLVAPIRMYAYSFYMWDDTTGVTLEGNHSAYYPVVLLVNVFTALYFFTPYSRDRFFVAALGYYLAQAIKIGQVLGSLPLADAPRYIIAHESDRICMLSLFAGLCCILMRYQIVLPSQLQKAKYLRLSYLYKMRIEGRTITRCQEIPESAFGNPTKVRHLIIISHRWLDRYTCDVVTPDCPQGLRLTTMCRRLELFYPWHWPGCSGFLCALSASIRSALYSSHDVLIFFDFMSLPQIGKNADGSLIDRTEEEKKLFAEVLPAMGGLYTMFPVMVCPEVCDGSIPYAQSGWCFCEWEQASVHDKLQQYFINLESCSEDDNLTASMQLTSATAGLGILAQPGGHLESDEAMEEFEKSLQQKKFFFDGDRDVVRGIVRGTRIRRMLLDAVVEQDVTKVKAHLDLLKEAGLAETIDFAIDHRTMDTLLHMAMKFPSKEIADALVEFGADIEHPNQRGEAPGQFFIFPRSWVFG